MEYTNKHNLITYDMWANLTNQLSADYKASKKKTDISVTQIKDSPLVACLKHEYQDLVQLDITDTMIMSDGSVAHKAWEKAAPKEWLVEHRFFKEINGWLISGQADFIIPTEVDEDGIVTDCILGDYKKTSIYKLKKDISELHDFEQQLNLLNWLMRDPDWVEDENGNPVIWTPPKVVGHVIMGYAKDFSKSKGAQNDFPSPVKEIDMPIWDDDKMDKYVEDRIKLHQAARKLAKKGQFDKIPQCTNEEMWAAEDKYAVLKADGKRAINNGTFDTIEEAKALIKKIETDKQKYKIEVRKSKKTRCLFYCDYSQWCPYGEKAQEKQDGNKAFEKLMNKKLNKGGK